MSRLAKLFFPCWVAVFFLMPAECQTLEKADSPAPTPDSLYQTTATVRYWPLSRTDFDEAGGELKKAVDRNGPHSAPKSDVGNGLIDYAEFALIAGALSNEKCPAHGKAVAVWNKNYEQALKDIPPMQKFVESGFVPGTLENWATLVALYFMLGDDDSTQYIGAVMSEFIIHLDKGQYDTSLASVFGPDGDANGDGQRNRDVYSKLFGKRERQDFKERADIDQYVKAALGPGAGK